MEVFIVSKLLSVVVEEDVTPLLQLVTLVLAVRLAF